MAFCFVVFCSFGFALTFSLIPSSTTAEKAQWLVRYQKNDTKFELNEDALRKLSHLRKPLKVISAIGEARVGKSTTLNFVRHILGCGGKHEAEIEEVFETGDSWRAVTYGVWMSVCKKQNIVLLDVEGTNLGNEAITSHLSVFTALMSSSIVVFSPETIKNDILNFLYGVTRLSEHIFKGVEERNNFGHLHVVIRDPLSVSEKSFEDTMRDAIVEPSGEDEVIDNTRRAIATEYFHKDNITVSAIPVIANRKLLKDSGIKKNNDYWNAILLLSRLFKNISPHKMTLRGKLIDGETLIEIARTLIKMMNKNAWSDFGDNYVMVEKFLCEKIYHAVFVPIQKLQTVNEIEQRKESVLKAFKDGCALTKEVDKVEDELRRLISTVKEKEEEARQRRREEEARQRRREEEREENWRREKDINFGGQIEGAMKAVVSTGLAYGVYVLYGAFLSDARLKENVIAVIPSKYEALGVREVTWTWNEEAEKIGLHGEARGVIAQEVEKLYPWAVLTGSDGYKRVLYGALDYALDSMKEKRKEDKLCNKRNRYPNDKITQKHFLHLI